jgi:CHAT domain-containing protein
LFRLSFAALLNEKGRYLVEDYALHYAPATEVFNYTRVTKEETARMPARYLLVANPAGLPLSAEGKPFPDLPGSDTEVRNIARRLPPSSVSMLQGKAADEASVRRTLESANVIHLATHGIVNNADPLGSFLAFGRSGDDADHNGRLTAEEVYGLNLKANLVVLSACRTGLGRISGDGVAGLARAFFYAGAASVVSTLWDVADQTAARLVSDFYLSLGNAGDRGKSEALRTAQLQLLSLLRKGELRVDTPFGKLPLPEDPLLWAGFILMGEP